MNRHGLTATLLVMFILALLFFAAVACGALHVMLLVDGLYMVCTSYLCAGFVVERGKITRCAPILRRRLHYWCTVALRISA